MSQKMEWARQERGGEKIETGCDSQGSLFVLREVVLFTTKQIILLLQKYAFSETQWDFLSNRGISFQVTKTSHGEIWLEWSFLQQKWTLKISALYHEPFGSYPALNFEELPCFRMVVESIAHFCQLWMTIIFSPKFCSAWKLIPQ